MENTNQLAILINEMDEVKDEARTMIEPTSHLNKIDEKERKIDIVVDTIISDEVQKYPASFITHKEVIEVIRKGAGKALADGHDLNKVKFHLLDESMYVENYVLMGANEEGISAFDSLYNALDIDVKRLYLKRECVDNAENHFVSESMNLFLVVNTDE
ncbi:hypothetical protein [Bacillus bombysepticus]|uniref:hypothetical protein n=1 Tax=Bacillus bombysepticus TaxID=658666 RepID=UPI0030158C88